MAGFYAKKFKTFFILSAIVFYLFSTQFIGNLLLLPLESKYNKPLKQQNVDAVVILSGGHVSSSANLPIQDSAFKRFVYGVMIAKKYNLPIVFTGAGVRDYCGVDAAKDTLKELNNYLDLNLSIVHDINNSFSMLFEDASLNTYENALFSKKLFEKNGISKPKIYLVTSAFHMKRSVQLFKNQGFIVYPAATGFMISDELSQLAYFPSMGGLMMSYYALHEYIGILSRIILN